MRRIIYYFSGTGNSLRAATVIAERIGGAELINVRCDPQEVPARDAEMIGFVCPVYEWDVPGTFKNFLEKLTIDPKAYIFMVATYIAVLGKSFETVEKLLCDKGAHLRYAVRCGMRWDHLDPHKGQQGYPGRRKTAQKTPRPAFFHCANRAGCAIISAGRRRPAPAQGGIPRTAAAKASSGGGPCADD